MLQQQHTIQVPVQQHARDAQIFDTHPSCKVLGQESRAQFGYLIKLAAIFCMYLDINGRLPLSHFLVREVPGQAHCEGK